MTAAVCTFWENGESPSLVRKRTTQANADAIFTKRRRLDPQEGWVFPTETTESVECDELIEAQAPHSIRKRAKASSTLDGSNGSLDLSTKRRRLDPTAPQQQQHQNCGMNEVSPSQYAGLNYLPEGAKILTSPTPRSLPGLPLSTTIPPHILESPSSAPMLSSCRAIVVWQKPTAVALPSNETEGSIVQVVPEANADMMDMSS